MQVPWTCIGLVQDLVRWDSLAQLDGFGQMLFALDTVGGAGSISLFGHNGAGAVVDR